MRYQNKTRVLLMEPERCLECRGVFLSIYALRSCADHEGLEDIYVLKRLEDPQKTAEKSNKS